MLAYMFIYGTGIAYLSERYFVLRNVLNDAKGRCDGILMRLKIRKAALLLMLSSCSKLLPITCKPCAWVLRRDGNQKNSKIYSKELEYQSLSEPVRLWCPSAVQVDFGNGYAIAGNGREYCQSNCESDERWEQNIVI